MNSKEGGVTVRSNCRYATLPNKENRRWSSGHLFLRLALLRWIPPNSDCTSQYSLSNYQYNHSLINLCTPGRIRTPVKLTYSFGDCCLSRSATDVYFFWGRYRIWTCVSGFADRCLTTRPTDLNILSIHRLPQLRWDHRVLGPVFSFYPWIKLFDRVVSPMGLEPMTPKLKV